MDETWIAFACKDRSQKCNDCGSSHCRSEGDFRPLAEIVNEGNGEQTWEAPGGSHGRPAATQLQAHDVPGSTAVSQPEAISSPWATLNE